MGNMTSVTIKLSTKSFGPYLENTERAITAISCSSMITGENRPTKIESAIVVGNCLSSLISL